MEEFRNSADITSSIVVPDADEIYASTLQQEEIRNSTRNSYVPRQSAAVDTDELLARRLQQQLDEEATTAAARNSRNLLQDQQDLLRTKTYSGAYFGRRGAVKPYFTYSMMALCTLIMGLELIANNALEGRFFEDFSVNPLFGPSIETLVFLGAKRTDLIVDDKDFWRLIAAMFLHGGLLHLAFNMLFLHSFGTGLEREFGHSRVAYIYLTSGFFGVLMSAIFDPTVPSVGASGACYGLIGAAWADFWLNFGFYKNTNWKSWLCQLAFGTVLNICLGLIPTLDNFAHLGGLVAGFFAGLTVLTLPRYDVFQELKPDKCYQIMLKSVAILVVPVGIVSGLITMYVGIDVEGICPWCHYLNCVPTSLWQCEVTCEEAFTISFQPTQNPNEFSATLRCPRDIGEVFVPGPLDQEEIEQDSAVQVALCEEFCL